MSYTTTTALLHGALVFCGLGFAAALIGFAVVEPMLVMSGVALAIMSPILMVMLLVCPSWPRAQSILLVIVTLVRPAKLGLISGPDYPSYRPPAH